MSPDISPEDINVFEENQRSDDDELNTNIFNLFSPKVDVSPLNVYNIIYYIFQNFNCLI